MQTIANRQLVRNRARLGTGLHLGALAVFAIGLLLSTQLEASASLPVISWACIAVGMLFYVVGQTQLRRWGPQNRQDEQLGRAIRGLDDRYKLYVFLATALPDYILTGPGGVQVLIARSDSGTISCQKDKWRKASGFRLTSLFGAGPALGNPTEDAGREVLKVRRLLDEADMSDVNATPLVVFTDPKAQLQIEGSSVTVTRATQLKDVLRRSSGKGSVGLPIQRMRAVQSLLDERMRTAASWR